MSLQDKLATIAQVLANWSALADPDAALRAAHSEFHAHIAKDIEELKSIAAGHESRLAALESALGGEPVEIVDVQSNAGAAASAAGSTNDAPSAAEPQPAAPAPSRARRATAKPKRR